MKILVFEYATAFGLDDPELLFEGRAMLEGLLDDFEDSVEGGGIEDLGVHYLITKKFLTPLCRERWKKSTPHILEQDLNQWIEHNISNFDACLFVAAEENMELFELTRKIEENGVKVFGANSDAVLICSDKFKTYTALKNIVPVIDTHKIFIDDLKNGGIPEQYKFLLDVSVELSNQSIPTEIPADQFSNILKKKMVVKPADGVACQGIKIVESWEDIQEAAKYLETSLPYLLIQNFIEGEACSVSLLSTGKFALPLSLNRQKIEFTSNGMEYGGGEVPWAHPLAQDAMDMAKKAVESIDGLKGYVGVDLIISDRVHLVEINSRLTTPFVALRKLTDFNLVQAIIKSVDGVLPEECSLEGAIVFQKGPDKLDIIKIN